MADPGGRTVGRVSLRVLPDTSKLREDLLKVTKRIEATMSVKIPAKLDTEHFLLEVKRAVDRANEIFTSTMTVNLDAKTLEAQARDAKDKVDGLQATINADLDTALARARLAAFTRPRHVSIIASLQESSLARVATALGALSGARSAGNVIERIGKSLGNLDKALPGISAIVLALGTLTSAALASTAGLFSVGASLASIAAAGIALPGVLAGFAVGTTVMILALVDLKTQLASLGPSFARLQNVVSSTFWEGARQPILDLVNAVLPSLQTGMQGTAKALGGLFANLASSLQAALGPQVLAGMFASLNSSIDIAAKAMQPLAQLIATLGTVGAAYLPGLAQRFTDITTKLNEVTQAAAADGRLKGWIDGGIAAAGDLFSALGAIGQILFGINEAAQAAGAGGLDALAKNLHAIADVINGPAFQGALTTLFIGAGQAMDGLAASLQPLGGLFVALAPTLASALSAIGATVGQLLGGVARALSDPAIQQGINQFVGGLSVGIAGLMPALLPLAQALGAVMSVAGTLASVLGPVLGAAFSALAPVVTLLANTLQPLIAQLGAGLVSVIGQVAPLLMSLAQAVLPSISSVISALIPALLTVIGAVLPVIAQLIPPISQVLALVAGAVVQLLPPVAALVAQLVTSLAPILLQLVTALLPLLVTAFATVIPAIVAILPVIGQLVASVATTLMPIIEALLPVVTTVFNAVASVVQAALTVVVGVIKVVAGLITGDWKLLWDGIKQIVSGAWELIKAIIVGAVQIVVAVLKGAWDLVVAAVRQAWSTISGLVSGAWEAIKASVSAGIQALINFVGPGLSRTIALFVTLGPSVLAVLSNFASQLVESGRAIIDGLIQGIRSRIGAVADAVGDVMAAARRLLPFSPAKEGPFSGKGWTLYSGRSIAEGLAEGIRQREDEVRSAARAMASAARPMLAEISSSSFQTPAAAMAAAVSGPQTFNLYDADKQLIGTMRGIAQGSVSDAAASRLVASRMGAPA